MHTEASERFTLRRGSDHLLLREELIGGGTVYVGYVNGVEEIISKTPASALRGLICGERRSYDEAQSGHNG